MKTAFVILLLAALIAFADRGTGPFPVPKGFPPPLYAFDSNKITRAGFELGRKLFYDGRLSKDGNFPCASCHQQYAAFSTYEHRLSHGFNNEFSFRNAPALFNLAWQKELNWDGGVNHLDVQPLAPLLDPHEMAETLPSVLGKLKKDSAYPRLFTTVFGSPGINSQRVLRALAQFTVSLISANSKYDKVKRGEASFSVSEAPGYAIFQEKCARCHAEPLFTDLSYRNTGLALNPGLKDYGRMRITGSAADSLKFKVPSLRNIYLTSPYGHDGRFPTLTDELNHYDHGIALSETLDSGLRKGIKLTENEKFYLIQFLGTLTDTAFTHNAAFTDPDFPSPDGPPADPFAN